MRQIYRIPDDSRRKAGWHALILSIACFWVPVAILGVIVMSDALSVQGVLMLQQTGLVIEIGISVLGFVTSLWLSAKISARLSEMASLWRFWLHQSNDALSEKRPGVASRRTRR
jgi:hypothetical protein